MSDNEQIQQEIRYWGTLIIGVISASSMYFTVKVAPSDTLYIVIFGGVALISASINGAVADDGYNRKLWSALGADYDE